MDNDNHLIESLLKKFDDPSQQILPRVSVETFIFGEYYMKNDALEGNPWMKNLPSHYPIIKQNKKVRTSKILLFTALALTAALSAPLAFFIDATSQELLILRLYLLSLAESHFASVLIWVSYSLILALIAASFGDWLCQAAEGAGFAELRVILTGIEIPNFFGWKTLLAKTFGLICAIGAGLSIGKEGPNVHMASIIAERVISLGPFKRFKKEINLRYIVLTASIAAGTAATFGTPLGGAIFGIELTGTYFFVNNFYKSIFCSLITAYLFKILQSFKIVPQIGKVSYDHHALCGDFYLHIITGLFTAIIGVTFVKAVQKLTKFKNKRVIPWLYHRYRYTTVISVFTSLTTFYAFWLRMSDAILINLMFSSDKLPDSWIGSEFLGLPGQFPILILVAFLKIILLTIDITIQAPVGFFTPCVCVGAILGRIFGEFSLFLGYSTSPGIYAAVGAASLATSTTHTLSVALMIFEMIEDIHFLVPMCLSVFISYAVSSYSHKSIYDTLISIKNLPFIPSYKHWPIFHDFAKDVADSSIHCINRYCTIRDLVDAFNDCSVFSVRPVIDDDFYLIGEINATNVKKYLSYRFENDTNHLSVRAKKCIWNELTQTSNGPDNEISPDMIEEVEEFWQSPVNLWSEKLKFNTSPLFIAEQTPLYKVHYIFMMLGLMHIYVVNQGKLTGIIAHSCFSQKSGNYL
ncbi:unnamed protein product [Blepharisma stoltei]|uniref:Chloride channel protein n=1 Tax=Blepharisma stoltei TaxID=1481888 RepID=A0AAU9IVS3_9CILI|nr:unnamed protein product [Blepharisma stoltei]